MYSDYTHTYDTQADAFGPDTTANQHAAVIRFIENRVPVIYPGIKLVAGLKSGTSGPDDEICEEIDATIGEECMAKLQRMVRH